MAQAQGVRCAYLHCTNEIVPSGIGRPPLYCSGRCRQRAYKRRQYEASGRKVPGQVSAPKPRRAKPDDQVAVAVLEAERLAGALIRLGGEAQPRLAWRCRKLGDVIATAIDDYFEGVL